MTKDKELEQLRAENTTLCDALRRKDEELKQAIIAIGSGQERVNVLEGLIDALQERNKTLERQQAKDSHNSILPPSFDRFVRAPKSLRHKSGKKASGQPGHHGHHLRQVEMPDEVLVHPVLYCEQCQHDLRAQPTAARVAGSPTLRRQHHHLCHNLSSAVGQGGNQPQSCFGEDERDPPG